MAKYQVGYMLASWSKMGFVLSQEDEEKKLLEKGIAMSLGQEDAKEVKEDTSFI